MRVIMNKNYNLIKALGELIKCYEFSEIRENFYDNDKNSILHHVYMSGIISNIDFIGNYLTENDFEFETVNQNKEGMCPIHYAAMWGFQDVSDLVLIFSLLCKRFLKELNDYRRWISKLVLFEKK